MNFTELDKLIREPFLVSDWIMLSHDDKQGDGDEFITFDFRDRGSYPHAQLFLNRSSERPVGEHTHNMFELMYVYEGSITHNITGGGKEVIGRGGFIMFSPGTSHTIDDSHGSIALNIRIKKDYWNLSDIQMLRENYLFSNFFLTENPIPYFVVPAVGEQDENIMKNILCEFLDPDVSSSSALKGLLIAMINILFRRWKEAGGQAPLRSKFVNTDLWEIVRYIELNFRTATLKEAGERFGYDPAYISRLIKKRTGQSFLEIKQRISIDYAKSLLVGTKQPINEVIESSGFSNANHFYSLFNKYCGITPAEYRKRK